MWNVQEFGVQYELTMTGQSRTTTSRRKKLCTWNCVCVVKLSWRTQSSCWTVRRPTPMTTWKPRATQCTWRPTLTWHTWWTRECVRSVSLLSSCSVSAVTHMSCTHRMAQVFACLCHLIHAWSERFFWPPSSLSSSFSHSSSTSSNSCYPSTSPKISSNTVYSATKRWCLMTNPSPTQ